MDSNEPQYSLDNEGDESTWMGTQFSLDELEAEYKNYKRSITRREHALYRYWILWIKTNQPFTMIEAESLVSELSWTTVVCPVVVELCVCQRLTLGIAEFLLNRLSSCAFTQKELTGYLIARNVELGWEEKLIRVMGLPCYTAARKIVEELDSEHTPKATEIIRTSNSQMGRKTRGSLIRRLKL